MRNGVGELFCRREYAEADEIAHVSSALRFFALAKRWVGPRRTSSMAVHDAALSHVRFTIAAATYTHPLT
jgi:hypothetical protein